MSFPTNREVLLVLLIIATLHPFHTSAQTTTAPSDSIYNAALVAEAETFMAGYAEDLRRGDRAAIAERYDPAGVHELRPARVRRSTHQAIASHYHTRWEPPSAFEWQDLVYDVVGPDAVVVSGLFTWISKPGGARDVQSYAALLRRQPDGRFTIRLEAEAGLPAIPWQLLLVGSAMLILAAAGLGWTVGRRRAEARIRRLAATSDFSA